MSLVAKRKTKVNRRQRPSCYESYRAKVFGELKNIREADFEQRERMRNLKNQHERLINV